MTQEKSVQPYQGQTPARAGLSTFLSGAFVNAFAYTAIWAAGARLFKKVPFTEEFSTTIRSKLIWGMSAGFSAFNTLGTVAKAKVAQEQHEQLVAENAVLTKKSQEAAELLEHIAAQIDKNVPVNKASVGFDLAANHAAKIEAEEATAPLEESAAKISQALQESPAPSHADRITAEKARAAQVLPTV